MEESSAAKQTKPVKLPYFHRTLSEEESKLIGDITPKPIDPASITTSESSQSSSKGSAWNGANTWEERDHTPWAKAKVVEVMSECGSISFDDFSVAFLEASGVVGHANITHVRGKARYLYDLSFDLQFEIEDSANTSCTGKLSAADVSSDMLDDLELSVTWTTEPPSGSKSKLANFLLGKKIREMIKAKMQNFDEAFKAL